eukprot:CAMPEP_0202907796 /NCGR_PEP_ID=MMETSP1392-20130828/43862_1 /ASSEMBLY_ACC=CAM_ASM_000868 /TAXON_ID=225041 /ORGANISM="Chlamydomonas chlamydogama, Strain SAG 11-48b" /LENGTH=44 /DNA_ID= /DNA_START= /DNA_END= /DNA_ORIENTATION=
MAGRTDAVDEDVLYSVCNMCGLEQEELNAVLDRAFEEVDVAEIE